VSAAASGARAGFVFVIVSAAAFGAMALALSRMHPA
jgi:hypothetical protein